MPSTLAHVVTARFGWGGGLLLALGLALPALAQNVSGTSVITATSICPSYCTDFQFSGDGGVGSAQAAAFQQRMPGWGAWAQAQLNGSQSLPLLKAYAETPSAGFGSDAEAFGVQMFTYQGPDVTRQLQLSFSGSGAVLELDVIIYNGADFLAAVANGASPWLTPGTMIGEIGVGHKAWSSLNAYEANGQTFLQTDTLSFDLVHGEQVVIWAWLRAGSVAGSIADGGNTVLMSFDDGTGLAPQLAGVVPEPASVALMLAGLALLAWRLRRAA